MFAVKNWRSETLLDLGVDLFISGFDRGHETTAPGHAHLHVKVEGTNIAFKESREIKHE
jgi:hypothetical protein